jgi:serine/threonine protein kinase
MNVSNDDLITDIIENLSTGDIIQSTERSVVSRTTYNTVQYIVKSKVLTERPDLLRFQLEVDIHKLLASSIETQPYVAEYIGHRIIPSYETDDGVEIPTTGYYIQENIQGIDLQNYLTNIPAKDTTAAVQMIDTLVKAVNAIHTYIFHNDIKPENIVVVSPTDIRIIDFETACLNKETKGYASCTLQNKIGNPWGWGTPNYYPINIAEGSRERKPYDILMDRYALGKVLIHIVTTMIGENVLKQSYIRDIFREYMEPMIRTNTHDFKIDDANINVDMLVKKEQELYAVGGKRNTRKRTRKQTSYRKNKKAHPKDVVLLGGNGSNSRIHAADCNNRSSRYKSIKSRRRTAHSAIL